MQIKTKGVDIDHLEGCTWMASTLCQHQHCQSTVQCQCQCLHVSPLPLLGLSWSCGEHWAVGGGGIAQSCAGSVGRRPPIPILHTAHTYVSHLYLYMLLQHCCTALQCCSVGHLYYIAKSYNTAHIVCRSYPQPCCILHTKFCILWVYTG